MLSSTFTRRFWTPTNRVQDYIRPLFSSNIIMGYFGYLVEIFKNCSFFAYRLLENWVTKNVLRLKKWPVPSGRGSAFKTLRIFPSSLKIWEKWSLIVFEHIKYHWECHLNHVSSITETPTFWDIKVAREKFNY